MKEKKPWYRRMFVLMIVFIVLILLFTGIGTTIYLYARFLLGNDIVVKLSADKEALNLKRGEEQKVTFTASITTNPFCTATCDTIFTDISRNQTIESDEFTLRSTIPIHKEFTIKATKLGSGQELYGFKMQCRSTPTFLCRTSGESTTRDILITANYDPNEHDVALKQQDNETIHELANKISLWKGMFSAFEIFSVPYPIDLPRRLQIVSADIDNLTQLWKTQDYLLVKNNIASLDAEIRATEADIRSYNNSVTNYISSHNFNVDNQTKIETLRKETTVDREYDALCTITGNCKSHPSIQERAQETSFNLTMACEAVDALRNLYSSLIIPQTNYSHEATIKVGNIKQDITNTYLVELPENAMNTGALKSILQKEQLTPVGGNFSQDTLAGELVRQQPPPCKNITIPHKLEMPAIPGIPLNITLEEIPPQCCVFGKCNTCCITEQCRNENLPIILLHGHAFYQALSAEYSLDIFNKLQNRLEQDGYVNAGAITLYTVNNTPKGIWGYSGAPLTIKVSYYFDIFREPENYVVVQTNSENIDTYAIRLKDLIDTVEYKTGKPRVIIIAHSMGGLVTRRYMQIFGEDKIAKVILVATPNKGIAGDTSGYCPLIGEKLECRDMGADSLFLNKLNYGAKPSIPIYNIAGSGCEMKQGTGDGVVLTDNALLEGAKNFVINGTCNGLDVLHTSLLNINKYPETYDIIKEALK